MVGLAEIARLRLRNQRVMGGKFTSAVDAVGWLGAVQSQDYQLAKWTLGKRTEGLRDAEVDGLLADGSIVRTHILRPTWHFVLPADVRPMMSLTAPRIAMRNQPSGLASLDPQVVHQGLDAIGRALATGRRMTRAEASNLLLERGIVDTRLDAIPIFMQAELDLVVVSGGLAGRAHTWALADERLPPPQPFDRDRALADLTRRYFTSHGPATVADFTWWSSLTVADTRRGLEINAIDGAGLERLEVDGGDYWWATDMSDPAAPDDPSPTVHLMQAWDEYIVGYRGPRMPINIDGLAPASGFNAQPYLHAIVLDGQLVGWWRRGPARDRLDIKTRLLIDPSPSQRDAIAAAAERYGRFVGLPVSLSP